MNASTMNAVDLIQQKKQLMGLLREPAAARYQDGMNLYEFVRSNPTDHVDPSGQVTDNYGTNWEDGHDWLKDPTRRPDGYIGGMGYPPGHPKYNTRPDLAVMVAATCKPRVRACKECQDLFDARRAKLLRDFGLSPATTGIAGAGKGIIIGAVIKGGTMVIGNATEGTAIGPIGTVGGAAVGVAGTAAGLIDARSQYNLYKQQADEINRAYQECIQACSHMINPKTNR